MKLQLLTAVAVTALMAAPSLASASEQGWYVRGNVGYGALSDMSLTGDIFGNTGSEGNVAGSLGLGYEFGNNWRVELDGTQLWNDLGAIGGNINTAADMRVTNAMINAIYDFSDFGAWRPYVGAGIGLSRSKLNARTHRSLNGGTVLGNNAQCAAYAVCRIEDEYIGKIGNAWQLLAGLGYDINESLVWDTQYRYSNAGSVKYQGKGGSTYPSVLANGGGAGISTAIDSPNAHMLMTGFRYRFGGNGSHKVETTKYRTEYVAPMASMYACADGSSASSLASCVAEPMVTCWDGSSASSAGACPVQQVQCWDGSLASSAASCPVQATITCWDGTLAYDQASCPAQSYVESLCADSYRQEIIYYNFDKGQSAETRETIQRILDTSSNCAVGNINVIGHTDSSGSAAYNLGLSKRRAADVRRELIRQGVSKSVITSEGKGETQLFIDTGDGVKEQLNRRTEVLISLTETGVIN